MFELELKDNELLKKFCKVTSESLDGIKLNVNGEGVVFKSMDFNHFIMIELCLKKEMFSKYNVNEANSIYICENVIDFNKAIRSISNGLTLKSDTQVDLAIIEKQDNLKKTFVFNNEKPEKYDIHKNFKEDNVNLPFNLFKELLSNFNNTAILSTEPGKFTMQSFDPSEGKFEYMDSNINKKSKSTYSVQYLMRELLSYLDFDGNVTLNFDDNEILRLSLETPLGSELNCYIAPLYDGDD